MTEAIWIKKFSNGKVRRLKATDLDRNRVRFNWGYHDGAQEYTKPNPFRVEKNGVSWKLWHHDPMYIIGWEAGHKDAEAGTYNESSQPAWEAGGHVGTEEGVTPFRLPA